MDDDELKRNALLIYDAIFHDKDSVEIDGTIYPIKFTSRADLRKVTIGDYLFIEQNPEKSSQWAQKARAGHEIMWVMKGRKYLVRVMDSKYLKL
jgi:hypothetical protein